MNSLRTAPPVGACNGILMQKQKEKRKKTQMINDDETQAEVLIAHH